ncbi:hypothetical protein [Citreimonas salinaria]|uniref:Uncharacterized protein n=1 Tax=Citreimonas salinaria TaxID=321339 RepID=A0A1H3IRQ8_9RHOB|nr:hypothetical protein [Citreimonas salinaria]SDY29818.1 hypothetical protein SAMN05444340_105204 [Citreimonas salinaria]
MSLSGSWDEFVDAVREGLKRLAENTVQEAFDQAEADAMVFLQGSEQSLRRWGDALAQGKITKDDFEYLVGGQKDLAKMHALKAIGVTQARLERFRTGLISLVVSSAFDAIGL